MNMTKLSIIVPVYNVELYIRPCFESIFNQGLDDNDYEVIIINDGSTDKSMEMIADIICQHENIKIINQINQGLSVARNNGINAAMGEYIFMPDSDDLIIEHSLPKLLNVALKKEADIVVADFLKMNSYEIANKKIGPQLISEIKEKSGNELMIEDLNPRECFVWNALYKRQFLLKNNIQFVPGILYQDVPFNHECCIKAKKCIKASWLLNIYRTDRKGAATYSFNKKKAIDFCIAIAKTWELTQTYNMPPAVLRKLKNDVYVSFRTLIYATATYINDSSDRADVIKNLSQKAPSLKFNDGLQQKAVFILYKTFPMSLIIFRRLYCIIVEETIRPFLRQLRHRF